MYCWRITKYNPKYRDENGTYKKNEWTSIHDVGKEFDGTQVTFHSYLIVEDAYVNAINRIIAGNGINSIKVEELEKASYFDYQDLSSMGAKQYFKSLKNNADVSICNVEIIVRLLLREMMWCKLSCESMFVHFGYDYYMYIGSEKTLEDELAIIESNGLFVETMLSPYMKG